MHILYRPPRGSAAGRSNIPTPTVCVMISISAGMFRIQSEIPLAYTLKACFGLACMGRSATAHKPEWLKIVRAVGRVKEGFGPGFRIDL